MNRPDDDLTRRTTAAWELVAEKYAPDVEGDVAMLRAGGTSLLPAETETLAPILSGGGRAIHLQCSHGGRLKRSSGSGRSGMW